MHVLLRVIGGGPAGARPLSPENAATSNLYFRAQA
jgi:hypothetical protein